MKNIYSVTQVNSYIKNMFAQDFMLSAISVKGEVSNCKYHSSGHIYFTLKDAKGTIACVMFAGNRSGLRFRMEEGQQIVVSGNIDVYERDGKYQMYAKEILLQGSGLLYERFQQLKRELEEMGMFDPTYKQMIPTRVQRLGVVTAPTGAAVQDIISVATRRNPYVQIILYPAIVQGDRAAASIIQGIRAMERHAVDVIIIGRGGGSIEDLWAFNEEEVAKAIFDCPIPIISAVGHETDTTIADYVADLRAPTPSAAAELAITDMRAIQAKLIEYRMTYQRMMHACIVRNRTRAGFFQIKLQFLTPMSQIRERYTYALRLEDRLQGAMQQKILMTRHRLALYMEQMKGLSPIDKLNQGFSYTTDAAGRTLTDIKQVQTGDTVYIRLRHGELQADVTKRMEGEPI
ncbi:MAG: exodeoxyribonuclease VII large subunit [Lachnospiraceae bacterium]